MNFKNNLLYAFFISTIVLTACKSKTTDEQPDLCKGKNLVLTATVSASSKCSKNGSITARASGSSGFTFKIGTGDFGTDSVFNNLAPGSYSVSAKDKDGCTVQATFTVAENSTHGPHFTAVSNLVTTACSNACHTSGKDGAPKGIFATDCGIINYKALIDEKAIQGTMGDLTPEDKQIIIDWFNAGGKVTD